MKGQGLTLLGCFALWTISMQTHAQSDVYLYGFEDARHFNSHHPGNYYIRAGAFHNESNANKLAQSLKKKYPSLHVIHRKGFYFVDIGPMRSAEEVRKLAQRTPSLPKTTPIQPLTVPAKKQRRVFGINLSALPSIPFHSLKPMTQPSFAAAPKKVLVAPSLKPKTAPPKELPAVYTTSTRGDYKMGPVVWTKPPAQWSITASFGYTNYQSMAYNDGQTMLGRFVIGRTLGERFHSTFGLEAGVQSGNTMRLKVSEPALYVMGGLPIQTNVKPMFDVLVTLQNETWLKNPFFTELKAGPVYRSWVFEDRSSIEDLYQVAGEVQAGVGYHVSPRASLNLLYQGVFGAHPNFQVNDVIERTGKVSAIPIQNGVLLGLNLNIS